VSESLRPRVSNIAAVLGVAVPMLSLGGAVLKAYSDMAVDRATRAYMDEQHTNAIIELRSELKALQAQSVQMEILQRITAVETKVDGLVKSTERKR
jgi:hypothetical protein